MGATVTVKLSGPLFHSFIPGIVADIEREILEKVAQAANERVHYNLDRSIKHPTPYYETQVARVRRGMSEVITDRGVIYGPWLEGTGTRNKTTRFKGYAAFRKAAQTVRRQAPELGNQVVARNMYRLN